MCPRITGPVNSAALCCELSPTTLNQAPTENRRVNAVLHRMAITQLRREPRAQKIFNDARPRGHTKKEALRCLKRQLSDVVHRRMVRDQRNVRAQGARLPAATDIGASGAVAATRPRTSPTDSAAGGVCPTGRAEAAPQIGQNNQSVAEVARGFEVGRETIMGGQMESLVVHPSTVMSRELYFYRLLTCVGRQHTFPS